MTLFADLARIRCLFQLRAIKAAMGIPTLHPDDTAGFSNAEMRDMLAVGLASAQQHGARADEDGVEGPGSGQSHGSGI